MNELTVKDMKARLGYKNDISILRLIRNGDLNASFMKNRYIVDESEFERFIESRKGARAKDIRRKNG